MGQSVLVYLTSHQGEGQQWDSWSCSSRNTSFSLIIRWGQCWRPWKAPTTERRVCLYISNKSWFLLEIFSLQVPLFAHKNYDSSFLVYKKKQTWSRVIKMCRIWNVSDMMVVGWYITLIISKQSNFNLIWILNPLHYFYHLIMFLITCEVSSSHQVIEVGIRSLSVKIGNSQVNSVNSRVTASVYFCF